MSATATSSPRRKPCESECLGRSLIAILESHNVATDGRSYGTPEKAKSRQRTFLRALRRHDALEAHTRVRQGKDGRWRVYAIRAAAFPVEVGEDQ